jgi:hypothetical protein
MRLKPEKVENLSRKIFAGIKGLNRMQIVAAPEQVEGAIRRIFLQDLRREDDLEKEAEEILKRHRVAIDRQNMSYNTLVNRTKQELAKQKKIVL